MDVVEVEEKGWRMGQRGWVGVEKEKRRRLWLKWIRDGGGGKWEGG